MIENGMVVSAQAEFERQRFGADPLPEPGAPSGPLLHPLFADILRRCLAAQAIIEKAKVPE